MGDILIRNVPDTLRRSIERQAKKTGISLSEQVKKMLELADNFAEPNSTLGEVLREAISNHGITEADDHEYQEILRQIEDSRKQDVSRPMPYLDDE